MAELLIGLREDVAGLPWAEDTVPARFRRIAAAYADAVALQSGDRQLTYAELAHWAGRAAAGMLAQPPAADRPVGILAENNLDPIIAVLGVLAAGRPFVLLDMANPAARLGEIVADAGIELLVCGPDRLDRAKTLAAEFGAAAIAIDEDLPPVSEAHLPVVRPDDLAVIIYTSGSTGKPKGVCHTQRGLLHAIRRSTERLGISPADRWLLLANLAHAGGINGTLRGLLSGARVLPYSLHDRSIAELIEFTGASRATVLHAVPSVYRLLVRSLPPDRRFPELRLLLVGGEAMFAGDLARFKAHFEPGAVLVNHLGCTEFSGYCQAFFDHSMELPADGIVPAGRPPEGARVRVLDEDGREAPHGEAGWIAIESEFLAAGYWGLPDLTHEKFVPLPGSAARRFFTGDRGRLLPDGQLVFLGRGDSQVKIRGNRVELVEVENALRGLPGVADAAVLSGTGPGGETRLDAYLAGAGLPDSAAMRRQLADRLPDYMLPWSITVMDELPLNANGKLDRARLPAPGESGRPFLAPETAVETGLSAAWARVLGVDRVGREDDFFDLGGNSLLLLELLGEIEAQFGLRLPAAAVIAAPTPAALAGWMAAGERAAFSVEAGDSDLLVPIRPGPEELSPLFLIHGFGGGVSGYTGLARRMAPGRAVYGLQARGYEGGDTQAALHEMAADYVDRITRLQPQGPYFLGGYCFGGVIAFEMACLLEAQGRAVGQLAVFEGFAPRAAGRGRGWLLHYLADLPHWFEAFVRAGVRPALREIGRQAGRRWFHLRRRLGGAAHFDLRHFITDDPDRVSAQHKQLMARQAAALNAYPGRRYGGRISLFRVRGVSLTRRVDRTYNWGRLAAGGVDVRYIAGRHDSILEPEHVGSLAAALDEAIGVRHAAQ